MPVPSPRNSIRIARGDYTDLNTNVSELGEGELVYALDQDKFYTVESGALVEAGTGLDVATAETLATARTIGGVSFDGSANINLPGVNTAGNQDTSGNAATATTLETSRTISLSGDVSGSTTFNGSSDATITATVADDSHNHVIGNVDGLQDNLDLKAPLDSPALTGTPTAPTATAGTNTTQVATTAFVGTAVANLVDTAPATLDTLNELAAALGDDPNFATTVSSQIGDKLDSADYTAADVLTKIKTVDGSTSGLDADLLDGQEGSYYRNASNINAGTIADTYLPATISSDITGNAATATTLETARTIGGVSFDGSANINLPGVNTAGNQDTSGNAATATKLDSARSFAVTGDVTGSISSDLTSGASISTSIASGVIVDADVNASAAIAGTKIDPDFGSQTVETTGDLAINTNTLFVDSSEGKVGLGTSSPSEKLEVATSSGVNGISIRAENYIASVSSVGANIKLYCDQAAIWTGTREMARIAVMGDGIDHRRGGLGFFTKGGAGDSSVTERMRISPTGNVGVGTTSPSTVLDVNTSSGNSQLRISNGTYYGYLGIDSGFAGLDYSAPSGGHRFRVGGSFTEAARIDSSGRLLVGTSTQQGDHYLQVEGSATSSSFAGSIFLRRGLANASIGSTNTLGIIDFGNQDGGKGAAISAVGDGQWATDDYPSRLVFSTNGGAPDTSPTERMRISSNGFIGFQGAASSGGVGTGKKLYIGDIGDVYLAVDGAPCAFLNRNTNDGSIVSIRQGNTEEGSISVSGTSVTLNGAHLSRWSQIPGIDPHDKDQRPEILRGTVMSNLDEMCDWIDPESGDAQDNEQLNKTKISDVEGDKNVAGIFQSWDDDDGTWVNDFYLAMTGDFIIRIAAGVTVERGDLLMSAGDGTAKPQDDDIIRSKTIAKVTSTVVSETYADGSYCVPCVLMAC